MDLSVYGHGELDRGGGVRVAADGTFAWLGYPAIQAAGRSVAELRADLEARLERDLLRRPVVMIQPDTVVGHRYHVMGKVIDKGSYPLDRPLRLLDAIARCRGIEVGLQDGSTVEIADYDHSLLIRRGTVVPIDFQALLQDGDVRYNIHIHPGDFAVLPKRDDQPRLHLGRRGRSWNASLYQRHDHARPARSPRRSRGTRMARPHRGLARERQSTGLYRRY